MTLPEPFHRNTEPATACQQDSPSKQGNSSSMPSLQSESQTNNESQPE